MNTNLFQRCVHVWLDSGVEIFYLKTGPFFAAQPVKIIRLRVLLSR